MTSTIEDQIRRFLAIARDSGASTNEREVALERASILMARHSITRLSDRSSPAVRRDEIETRTIMIPGGMTTPSLAQAHAVHQVAQACGATTYYTDERRRPGSPGVFVHVVGFDSDLDWLAPLITALTAHTASAWTQWRKASPGYKRMKPANQRRARAGFILGYAQGVAQRIRTTRRATITEQKAAGDSSAALTVRDRSRRLADYITTLDLHEGSGVNTHERALKDGRDAGWNSHLGTGTPNLNNSEHRQIAANRRG
ncbi:DUF2786 domain-containing protein [Schaalia cardiffensis]|uniref:DUF7168 domain-containing protein n=1 Tax=Schaalia cardiffensis TaxID=181487 RepID=UPI0018E7B7AA|nr:DUF2786 domain-containing protein [Schaalia cardiffensis]MBJ2329486.1 DUF2786 domain-containing protein [Schaalia cardiffensis]